MQGYDDRYAGSAGEWAPAGGEGWLSSAALTVGDVEQALYGHFPHSQADPWDRDGILVGDPDAPVSKIALALDADSQAVREASNAGCNVLITHHPAYLDPPVRFGPAGYDVADAGAAVFEAAARGVALINYHTCLDRALVAQQRLPQLLGLQYLHALEGWAEAIAADGAPDPMPPAYGAACLAPGGMTLGDLAARCDAVLGGRACRVWGDSSREVLDVGTCTGSAGSLTDDAIAGGLDALVAGEVRYHSAVDAAGRGLAIIELGHDVSELPLVDCIEEALLAEGVPPHDIVRLDLPVHWHSS